MDILKKEDNGVEFYTIELTGQSGMSETGLSILTGVTRKTLQNLEDTLQTRMPLNAKTEVLKDFVGVPLTLDITKPVIEVQLLDFLELLRDPELLHLLLHPRECDRVPARY